MAANTNYMHKARSADFADNNFRTIAH